MILIVLTSLFVCLMAWIYVRWLKVKCFWAKRGVPFLPPHPIYGSLTFLQKINTSVWMRQIYDHFQSPYVGIWLFWRPALVVNCPEIARNILVKDSANFRDRFLSAASHDSIGSLNVFTCKDPLWSNIRRRLTPAFTSSKLKQVHSMMTTKAKELVQRIAIESKKGKFDYREPYYDFTTDIIGTASFGVQSDATLTGTSPLREVTKGFEQYSLMRGIAWSFIFFFPELVGLFRFRFFPKSATDYFRKIYSIVVEQRKAGFNDNADPRDLLDVLLKMKKDIILENGEISDELLISQAAIFILAGFHTSANLLTYATYELAHHPEIQEELYIELKDAKEKINGADFDENTLANLMYFNCVIKECLRKYAPMGWFDRKSSDDYKVDDKLTIPAGTPVYVNGIAIHYDPNYFPDPTRFNPDRFLPVNEVNIKKFTYIPFGEGPRKCMGQRFGYANVRIGLSYILLHYKLKPVPNTPKPIDIEIDKYGMFLSPGEKMYVEFVPRD